MVKVGTESTLFPLNGVMTRFTKVEDKQEKQEKQERQERQEKQEDEEEGILDSLFSHRYFLGFFPFGNTKVMATFALLVVRRLWPRC